MTDQTYKTFSKFGRIHLDGTISSIESRNINIKNILSEIKHINDRPLKKRTESSALGVSQRLLFPNSTSLNMPKTRSSYLPRQQQKKKALIVRKYEKQPNIQNEIPSSAQYTPNYEVCFPSAPSYLFPRAYHERMINANLRTQSEMIKVWEKGPRTVKFGPKSKDKKKKKQKNSLDDMSKEEEEEYEASPISTPPQPIVPPPPPKILKDIPNTQTKPKKQPIGIMSLSCERDSFIPKSDVPPPGQYYVKHNLIDKTKISSFEGQSTRKHVETPPDRPYYETTKGIDSIKPNPPRCVPFNMQLSRNKEVKQKDIWAEIEKEQKQLYNVLHPQEKVEVHKKEQIQPFSQQTSYFDKHPFQSFMGPEETKDLTYDVDLSIKLSDKKIKPYENFGRRKNDSDRAIYANSEAPDVIYTNVNDQWFKTRKSYGSGPIFNNMHARKSVYDYMPKIDGGNYTSIKSDNWSYRTPVLMDKMGEREMMLNLPPQCV